VNNEKAKTSLAFSSLQVPCPR